MDFVLHAGGMPFNGETIPQGKSLGGSETAAYYLSKELAAQGHKVTLFTNIQPDQEGIWDGVRYLHAGQMSAETPLGQLFEQYARHIPHDVLIIQRAPFAFHRPYASKINYWWTHDLALKRHSGAVERQLWNITRIFCVSDWHREQLAGVYGVPQRQIGVLPNAVDSSLFLSDTDLDTRHQAKRLVYSSRPERGLDMLVNPGGIMEQLLEKDPEVTLLVAGYDNTTEQMAPLYQQLWDRCRMLPNVELVGPLGKTDLAQLMGTSTLHVYPTAFEETSCITAMEAQTAGLPMVTTKVGALPETLQGGGVYWVQEHTPEKFVYAIQKLLGSKKHWTELHLEALRRAKEFKWEFSADGLLADVKNDLSTDPVSIVEHLVHHSDIYAAKHFVEQQADSILSRYATELLEPYRFAFEGDFAGQYERLAAWEKERGIDHGLGQQHLYNMPRFQLVLQQVKLLGEGATVLDYACGQGHFTYAMAKIFPAIQFIGTDIAVQNIEAGRLYLKDNPLPNLKFIEYGEALPDGLDMVVAAEIFEHVPEPWALSDQLEGHLKEGGRMVATIPYGPWEASTYDTHPHRMHVHHLERADIEEIWAAKADLLIIPAPAAPTEFGEPLGTHLVAWNKTDATATPPTWKEKFTVQAPPQTLSVCIITRADSDTLARTLRSVAGVASEIIVGIDGDHPRAWEEAHKFGAKSFGIDSPTRTGFAQARNATIEKTTGDWILWIDSDEVLVWPERLKKYLRQSPVDALALPQHHFSAEPAGLIKTDYPARVFRNNRGAQFFGRVHEHPEIGLNGGWEKPLAIDDVSVCHYGYETENIRRERFRRNLPLLKQDRAEHPERKLGQFLWLRDLTHLNDYEFEQTRQVSPAMHQRAEEAVELWRGLIENDLLRYALDGLEYYSRAASLVSPTPVKCTFGLSAFMGGVNLGDHPDKPPRMVSAVFSSYGDAELLMGAIIREKGKIFQGDYL